MKAFSLVLSLLVFAGAARADTELVLQQGQCAQVDSKNYCWYFRPSTYLHPELAPRPCDFRHDCPITLLIPASNLSPNVVSTAMDQKLNHGATRGNPNVMFFCRKQKENFSLVRVEIKGSEKYEVAVNDYGDDEQNCKVDESRYSTGSIQSVTVSDPMSNAPPATTGPVIVDTTQGRQAPCPQTKQYKTEIKKIPVNKLLKKVF